MLRLWLGMQQRLPCVAGKALPSLKFHTAARSSWHSSQFCIQLPIHHRFFSLSPRIVHSSGKLKMIPI